MKYLQKTIAYSKYFVDIVPIMTRITQRVSFFQYNEISIHGYYISLYENLNTKCVREHLHYEITIISYRKINMNVIYLIVRKIK